MSKIKKIWTENKILFVLGIILIICLCVFLGVSLTYFYSSNTSEYGNRLDILEKTPLNDKLFTDIKDEMTKSESVTDASATLKGKIVYVIVSFKDDTKIEDAKKVAEGVIPLFNEDELNVYDIQLTIKSSAFTLMGARNSNGSGSVVWNNYNVEG